MLIRVTVRLTEAQLEKLKKTRLLTGSSVTQTIRYAIDQYYDKVVSER